MSVNELVASKMEEIKKTFQQAKELASTQNNLDQLIDRLEKTDSEFRSVAFEGASMEIALNDLKENNYLKNWNVFLNLSSKHAPQIYIGLGWAIAQEKYDSAVLNEIEKSMRFRVWDGCGYYDGILRQKQTIKNQIQFEYIPKQDVSDYDEGLGRSLWYICKGDEDKLTELIAFFPSNRHSNLWRGIGIACSYVGGCDEERLKKLLLLSGEYSIQLAIGSELVVKSRIQSGCITKDTELAYSHFYNLLRK